MTIRAAFLAMTLASITDAAHADSDPPALEMTNSLGGATGLLRTYGADSARVGTFRMALLGTLYEGTGFLCPACEDQNGNVLPPNEDAVSQLGTRFQLSMTFERFYEVFGGFRYLSTWNDQADPEAIQRVGDMSVGMKFFTPVAADQVFSFGGAVDAAFLASAKGLGVDAVNVGIRALGTADFTRRANPDERIPLRINLNAGYSLDGSGQLADEIEKERAAVPSTPRRITRIERFGHAINRVDTLRAGLGIEGAFRWVRPFAEWTIDVPVNRQSHECGGTIRAAAGDGCLRDAGWSAMPSRLSIGARIYPWLADWLEGLSVLLALDIGTGATRTFIEEVAPERPWALQIGLGYAVDTTRVDRDHARTPH